MILVDTSVWIEFDRRSGSPANRRLRELIATSAPVAITEPIAMEVLAGVSDERKRARWRRLLARFEWAPFDAAADFAGAETIYRTCRRSGVTPRGLIDCMIAAVALRHGAVMLSHDRDLARVGDVMGIHLDRASLT